VSFAPRLPPRGFFLLCRILLKDRLPFDRRIHPANVSLRAAKDLSFSKIREPICPKKVRGRKKFSVAAIIYFKFLQNDPQSDTAFLIFMRPTAIPILRLRASAGSFIYTQLHSSGIANADSDSQ
jgi:hypothetical protein